ncbi:hypothetical protein N665_0044s0021, partial [Sinapis alba]
NFQGLGRSQDLVIPRLREIRSTYFHEVLFLMETMHSRNVLVDIHEWLGYNRVHTVEPIGQSGGLALFYKKNVNVELKFVDKNLLDCFVQFDSFRIGVNRRESWCMLGDFNDILHNGEKSDGPLRKDSSCIPFSNMINACRLSELPSTGNALTWSGMRNNMWIQCQVDRCFGNKEWFQMFPASNQGFLEKRGSDHKPVLLSLVASQDSYKGQFKFDSRFLHQPNIKQTVFQAWNVIPSHNNAPVSHMIRLCRKALSKLKKVNNLNSKSRILDLQTKLYSLKIDLMKAYKDEKSYWSQKSKEKWAKSGDKNTKFFHSSVLANRSKKYIEKLTDEMDIDQINEGSKGVVAVDYFSLLFTSSNPLNFHHIFRDFQPKMQYFLLTPLRLLELMECQVCFSAIMGCNRRSGYCRSL